MPIKHASNCSNLIPMACFSLDQIHFVIPVEGCGILVVPHILGPINNFQIFDFIGIPSQKNN